MKKYIFISIKLTLLCLVFFSGIYTLFIWGIAQFSPNQGKGFTIQSKMQNEGNNNKKSPTYYYSNIGHKFTKDNYFYSRPSAVDYNAAGGAGSNKGPSNPEYLKEVQARIDTFMVHNPGIKKTEIPADLVTASGSGLDPNISVQSALVQVKRISNIRNIPEEKLISLINEYIEKPLFDVLGPEKINVLELNMALDQLK